MTHPHAELIHGDMFDAVPLLPEASVHCVVTSPPYWGLRDYGVPPRVWGGDPGHAHGFVEMVDASRAKKGNAGSRLEDAGTRAAEAAARRLQATSRFEVRHGFCGCGAWRGCLGLEPDYRMYVAHVAEAFDLLARVLRPDGVAWLVIGDCYATGAGAVGECPGGGEQGARWAGMAGRADRRPASNGRGEAQPRRKGSNRAQRGDGNGGIPYGPMTQPNRMPQPGLKPKDLAMIPARVALELQARGWWLRADVIWDKPNPMPESARDRPTLSNEHVLLLSRAERYFYDWYAIAEPSESGPADTRKMAEAKDRYGGKTLTAGDPRYKANASTNIGKKRGVGEPGIRNARSVWRIATVPYPGPHFATFPPELVARCIRAGTPDGGVCATCGSPAERLLGDPEPRGGRGSGNAEREFADGTDGRLNTHMGRAIPWVPAIRPTVGWELPCPCRRLRRGGPATRATPPLVPATILDPFGGSGTTAAIAVGLGRRAIYVDANGEYVHQARHRIGPLLCAEAE